MLKEHELVDQKVIDDNKSYNLKIGGEGGWDYINNVLKDDPEYRKEIYDRMSNSLKESYASGKLDHVKKATTERNKKLWAEGKLKRGTWSIKGCILTEEHKKKISDNNGNKLSQKEIDDLIYIVKNSKIDFSVHGWVGKLAPLISRKPQKVNYIIKKYMPDFYQQKCFKRENRVIG